MFRKKISQKSNQYLINDMKSKHNANWEIICNKCVAQNVNSSIYKILTSVIKIFDLNTYTKTNYN